MLVFFKCSVFVVSVWVTKADLTFTSPRVRLSWVESGGGRVVSKLVSSGRLDRCSLTLPLS